MSPASIFLQEKLRSGSIKRTFSVQDGVPRKIKVCLVSSEFSTKNGLSLMVTIRRSLDGGSYFSEPQAFVTYSGNYDSGVPESSKPGMIFNWDGKASIFEVELNVPVPFLCGFSFEVI